MPRYKKKKLSRRLGGTLIIFALGIFLAIFIFLKTGLWDGKSKFSVVATSGDDVLLSVLDPRLGTISEIIIPGDTQVLVAGNLGSWKLSSVWQLGLNEGRGGDLLAKTVAKNFSFPVFAWQGQGKSNLRLGDRLRLRLFAFAKESAKSEINLADFSQFLVKKTLVDGSQGRLIQGKVPKKIEALFADEDISDQNLKAQIVVATGEEDPSAKVARIIEVIGIKVAAISQEEPRDFGCLVRSKDQKLQKDLARIFACKEEKWPSGSSFDVEIILGSQFTRSF